MVRKVRDTASQGWSGAVQLRNGMSSKDLPSTDTSPSVSISQSDQEHGSTVLSPLSSTVDSKPKEKKTAIYADLLIPGDGEPIENAALLITNDVITFAGPASDLPSSIASSTTKKYNVPVLMPGLWDCHIHLGGWPNNPDYATSVNTHPTTSGARLARSCWELINAGYTSVRDLGGYGIEVYKAVEEGHILGPTIYSAGSLISQLGGHGDIFDMPPSDVLRNFGSLEAASSPKYGGTTKCIADGVEGVRRAVRLQIRRGATVIKVFASGGVLSLNDDPEDAQYSPEELRTIVDEAWRQKRYVAAHVHGKDAIIQAINAGCKTLEHVSYADSEVLKLMKEKDLIYVATRAILEAELSSGGKNVPPPSWRKLQEIQSHHWNAYKLAIKSGVKIVLGTDFEGNLNEVIGIGKNAVELEYAVKAGMTPLEAIRASTAMAPECVGEKMVKLKARARALASASQGTTNTTSTTTEEVWKVGQLKPGFVADVIAVFGGNPVEDVGVLQVRENVKYVWKSGRLLKGPGVGAWGEE